MTIEEKAKACDSNYKVYTELINRLEDVKDAIKKQNYGIAMDVLCKPYPEFQITASTELKKSEDERIRKELLNAFQEAEDSLYMVLTPNRRKSFIAWLEKQGNLMKALQISNARIGELIEKNYYLKEQLEKQGNNMGISEVTKQELEDNLNKALKKETPESCNEFLDEQGEQKTTIEMITPEESLGIDSDTYNKIVDECVYGEQKPIKEHNACEFCEDRYGCVSPCSMKLIEEEKPADLPKGEDYGIDGLYAAIDILQKTLGEVDGYQSDDGILTHKCAISAVKELSKQKPAWGEEDIELLDNTIKFIEDRVAATSPSLRTYSPTLTGKEIPFLKALKDRVQPKQEWSEEDKRIIDNLVSQLGNLYARKLIKEETKDKYVKLLKSLKERYSWKPSDVQMGVLLSEVTAWTKGCPKQIVLESLYNDLLKLKE